MVWTASDHPIPELIPIYAGFRNVGARTSDAWIAARKQKYLLRQDITTPISLDPTVTLERTPADEPIDLLNLLAVAHVDISGPIGLDWHSLYTDVGPGDWLLMPHVVLGYDVCDYYSNSALTNCDFPERTQIQSAYWRMSLNESHLFRDKSEAKAFAKIANQYIAAHAPFVPIELRALRPDPF